MLQKEFFRTFLAFEFFNQLATHVPLFVNLQIANGAKFFTTITTAELRLGVNLFMVVQSTLRFKEIVAYVAFERPFILKLRERKKLYFGPSRFNENHLDITV